MATDNYGESEDLGTRVEKGIVGFFKGEAQISQDQSVGQSSGENLHGTVEPPEEVALGNIAKLVLIGGIISALVLFFTVAIIVIPATDYTPSSTYFSWAGFISSIIALLSSVALYYICNVLMSISKNVREIKNELRRK